MNNEMTDHRTQYIAIFLIVFAVGCLCLGECNGWGHLIDFSTMFGGGGVGILTGQKMASVTNKDGGTINVTPPDMPQSN